MESQGPPRSPGRERPSAQHLPVDSLPAGDLRVLGPQAASRSPLLYVMTVPKRKAGELQFRGASEEPTSFLQAGRGEGTGKSIEIRGSALSVVSGAHGLCIVYPSDCCFKGGVHLI